MSLTMRRDREWFRTETAYRAAERFAAMSTCRRLRVGCVIASDKVREILAVGYNGPPAGLPNGSCSGVVGGCGCVHAEANAIVKLSGRVNDATLYTTRSPCQHCAGLIINSGVVKRIVYGAEYRDVAGVAKLTAAGVESQSYRDAVPRVIVIGERANGPRRESDVGLTPAERWRSSLAEGAFVDATSTRKLETVGVRLSHVRSANLLPPSPVVGEWSDGDAATAWEVALADQPGTVWLVCGERCWSAVCDKRVEVGEVVRRRDATLVRLPHPSGLSRWWNEKKNPPRLRRVLETLVTV